MCSLLILRPDQLPPLGNDLDPLLEQMNRDTAIFIRGTTCAELSLHTGNAVDELPGGIPGATPVIG